MKNVPLCPGLPYIFCIQNKKDGVRYGGPTPNYQFLQSNNTFSDGIVLSEIHYSNEIVVKKLNFGP